MFNIDFSKLPWIEKKLEPIEIEKLNGIFQDPSVQTQLETIEAQRKIRAKWKWGVNGLTLLVALGLSLLLWQWNVVAGFFYTIGTGDDSFSPTIWATVITYTFAKGALYARFASKIEIPLKKEVLSKLCPVLYSKLEYSYDEKHSFDEIDTLRSKSFLSSYDSIDRVEDSTHFTMEKDGKRFELNGFELETSEVRGSGKNRRRVTTNHCYLMKAHFPSARIPLSSDLFILSDQADSTSASKIIIPLLAAIFGGIMFTFLLSMFHENLASFGILWGIFVGIAAYFYSKKLANKNRVKLENIEFEKHFDIKCEDQVTSRMIITPAFMDRIVQFVEKTGNRYEFIFQENVMYVKRHISGTYLEAGTEKNMLTNLAGFVQFYTDMREIIQFVYDMNLMYLSKTDTSTTFEASNNTNTITPIAFSRESTGNTGMFGKFFSGFKLRV
jgi:hypothetical protein